MFSTMPRTGTLSFWKAPTPRRASLTESSCGVVTTTPPVSGTSCATLSCASPVPGRKVHDEVVELSPGHVGEELAQRAVDHRAAPDEGFLVPDEESHAHERTPCATAGTSVSPFGGGRSLTPISVGMLGP